jgi:rubrerythrin
MFKSTHQRLLKQAVENAEANDRQIADALASVREDTIKRLRQTVADREARITAMTPDFELGRKRRLNYEADNARRKAARKAAK